MKEILDKLYSELNGGEKQYFQILCSVAAREKPKEVLEIGTGWALSCLAWLMSGPDVTVTSIDKIPLPDLKVFNERINMFDKELNAWNRINIITGDSKEALRRLSDGRYDIVYIDGDHTYPGAKSDFDLATKKVRAGGCIMCDDVYHPLNYYNRDPKDPTMIPEFGVMRALGEWAKAIEKEVTIYPYANGMAFIRA